MYDLKPRCSLDFKEAARWFRLAADQGDVGEPIPLLGTMYSYGHGVLQDYKEAAKWYRLAADQGSVGAQIDVGNLYNDGHGVPQDFKESGTVVSCGSGPRGCRRAIHSR